MNKSEIQNMIFILLDDIRFLSKKDKAEALKKVEKLKQLLK